MKHFISFAVLLFIAFSTSAQKDSSGKLGGLFKKASSMISKSSSTGGNLSSDEIVSGLKEALSLGAQKSSDKLSATDGFFKDAAVKILLPKQIRDIENKLKMLGMGKLVEKAELSMNRAAEDASKSAAPIFLSA